MTVRTRFAPSPTGMMHVGGVRTALFAWFHARKHGGQFILRIEDTDKEREVEGSIGHIMESLRWLGIDWDEGPDKDGPYGPYVQSARLDIYRRYADELVARGHAYPDPYTEDELEIFRKQAEAENRPFLFRDHRPEKTLTWDGTRSLRFKTPEIKRFTWNDLTRGELTAGEEALDDFILIKADGYPTYNFAHVVDDIEMRITHVIRGEEFISSTPKFLSLYDALGKTSPAIATMPVILGPDGKKKLSKRDGAKDLLEYRADGYLPNAFVNFLALVGWHPAGDEEILSIDELINAFEIEKVQKSGGKLDEEKLLHINQEWMRRLTDEEYVLKGGFELSGDERLRKSVSLLKERARTFKEARELLAGELACVFTAPSTLDSKLLVSKEPAETPGVTATHLTEISRLIEAYEGPHSIEGIKTELMVYADKEGRGAVLWPLRYALSGAEKSPDPFSLIYILGREESLSRIKSAIAILG